MIRPWDWCNAEIGIFYQQVQWGQIKEFHEVGMIQVKLWRLIHISCRTKKEVKLTWKVI